MDDTYESIIQTLVPGETLPDLKGIQIILREFGAKDPAARSARPEQFVDLSIMKELDSSGFIDRVYKSGAVAKVAPKPNPWPLQPPRNRRSSKLRLLSRLQPRKSPNWQPSRCPRPVTRQQASAPTPKSSGSQQYTVKSGDTLSKLAGQFYNSGISGKRFMKPTKTFMKNPNYIYIGMKLMIPADDKAS